jgi:Ca-activated chloride channel family protein
MELTHPWFLALAPFLAVVLWWALRRSLAALSPRQAVICTAVRALLLLLLLLALAGLRIRRPEHTTSVIFAIDDSASLSETARAQARDFVRESLSSRRSGDVAGVIGFAQGATVWEPPAPLSNLAEQWPPLPTRDATELGPALDFASALLPPAGSRRIVLLSDGNDTGTTALEAARRAAARGLQLSTVPLRNASAPEVLVERVDLPRRLKTGEPFDLAARLRSNVATAAKVKLYENQYLIDQRDLQLQPGVNEYRMANLHTENSFVSYEVEVIPTADTSAENNRASATASLQGQPRVLIVDTDDAQIRPLAEALRQQKIQVETRGLAGLPKSMEDLQQFDLLLLSDVSALRLAREQMELYRTWVQELGGGFAMLGGENSFGTGGYYRTPIEQMLPVRMEHEDRLDTPSVALLVILDRSGSMTAQVQGQTKMSLADQGAVFAMNALQPKDYFGLLAVDTRAHTVVPLSQLTTRQAAEQKIMTITAGGGGIYVYTSLAEAFQILRDASARIKHVILFSDAADAEEKVAGEMGDGARSGGSSLDLAAAMVSARITISVVGLGTDQDKDTAFLRQLAERGNGRFYLTSDATTLPQIFSTETMRVAQSSLIEEPFIAVPATPNPMIAGVDWAQSPLLLGYNATKPKPTAEIHLATERGEPLLASWRYGLGKAAAFTSDAKSRWAAEWLTWPGYGQFWSQLVRGLMRRGEQSSFNVNTSERGDELTINIDALTPAGGFRNDMAVEVHALLPDQTSQSVPATQNAPGSYRASVALPKQGTTILSISSPALPDGSYTFGHTRSYPKEFLATEPNEALLRTLAGTAHGKFSPSPAEIFAPSPSSESRRQDVTDWLLTAFLLLLPVDIWLRRSSALSRA